MNAMKKKPKVITAANQTIVCHAECDKISTQLIDGLGHTLCYEVACNWYQFVCLLNHFFAIDIISCLVLFMN